MVEDGVNDKTERGKNSSSHQFFQNAAGCAPGTPAKPGRPDPKMVDKNWLQNPFDEAVYKEASVNKSFSCWYDNFGSTSQTYEVYNKLAMDKVATWNGLSFSQMLAVASATGGGQTQQLAEPSLGLSLQLTPSTPDQAKRAEDKRMNLAADNDVSTLFEKGLSGEANLIETPQPKQRRRKHRPKVVTEGKPKGVRKRATPNTPDGSSTKKRKYVRRKNGVERSSATPNTPNGSSIQKRKYVRRNGVERSSATPVVDGTSETIHPMDQEINKSCKRKIDFDESEKQARVKVDDKITMTSEVMGNYQKVQETESMSPITPSKTELPHARAERNYTKAKCKINFLQETHDKGHIHVPSSNESGCSSSVFNKGNETQDSLESYLSMYTDYSLGCIQFTQSSAINNQKGKYQPQHTYMQYHAADFHVSMPDRRKTKLYSMGSSMYHSHFGYNPNLRYGITYAIDALINQFERMQINRDAVVPGYINRGAVVPRYNEKNALVVYQQDRSIVPYVKKKKQRPKVDLDDETNRVWMLLLENINSEGIDGTDEDKAKWWEEERRVFRGRADSFIARMHLVQGDRRFSKWKGSVLDSVVGVYLTQNVSDHLSSSAFMSLAARYPLNPNTSSEPLHESGNHDSIPMMLQEADLLQEKEVVKSNESSKSCVISDNSECEVAELSEKESVVDKESVIIHTEVDETVSSCNFADAYTLHKSEEQKDRRVYERTEFQKNSENCASEESGISVESASQTTVEMVNTISSKKSVNINFVDVSGERVQKVVECHLNKNGSNRVITGTDEGGSNVSKEKSGNKETKVDWDKLRLEAEAKHKRERTPCTMDSMDYEAIRAADVKDVADAIKERGMNNRLAERIKDMLDRLVRDHGSTDLEWLRDVPPDKAKEYLLSFRGLGLKSVECIRLLTLHHLAFPVDTNVGRIAVRLGWVPLQALPESLQLHLLELYPVQESIQKYLWPRLCKLDQKTLYELHYQMITFGKVFCTKTKPNCNACPLRGECRHFASAFARDNVHRSARLALPAPEERMAGSTENKTGRNPIGMIDLNTATENKTGQKSIGMIELPSANEQPKQLSEVQNCNPVIEEPTKPGPIVEMPASPEPEQIQEEIGDIEDFSENTEEIPMIKLNIEEFTQNLQTYMERHMELAEGEMSKALVALTSEAASIPTPKLKNINQLRTEHQVYELPESHPLLEGLDRLEPDDPCSYLLAIWTPGETADSIQPPEGLCSQMTGTLCNEETCFFCNSTREANSQTVRGTLLIPCRTAMRGSFPLNGTYFQVNEVFADHESSLNPINVPRAWLWNLPRRTVYFGTSIPNIFKGLTTEEIQICFWRGFVCVRGFDRKNRAPRPLRARLHIPASRLKATPKTAEKEKIMR